MGKTLLLISLAFLLFVALDFAWFSVMGNFFKSEIGSLARLTPDGSWNLRFPAAIIAYVLMAIGLVTFVLPRGASLPEIASFGALFGLVSYGLYDLTNLATLTAWTVRFTVIDMAWGTVLNAIVAILLRLAANALK